VRHDLSRPTPAHDWEVIAARDAFFGVISAEEFRADRMDAAARARFFRSGEADIANVLAWFDADLGARPRGRALDVGCGVGRLTRAIAGVVEEAVGHDVSPTMVALAAEGAPPNARFTTDLPDGPFDWINSYIVLQHIPPTEGLALIEACLARAGPGAFLSLQLTGWRDGPSPSGSAAARAARWLQRRLHRRPGRAVDPLIRMHDYNFSEVMRRLTAAGFTRIVLRHTNHGGHHGAWMISRRG
jgi:SAM-dependent methyltransferase